MTFTWYDFVVLAILLYTTFRGASRGLVWQLAWIAALVLCFGFAETGSLALAPRIEQLFPQAKPPLSRWIAMLILYMGFSFLAFGVARVLRGWIEKAKFVEYDRHLGGIFGFVKGVIFALVLTFFSITLSDSLRETVLSSKSGYAAAVIMHKLAPVMPQELVKVLDPHIHQLDESYHEGEQGPFGEDDVLLGHKHETPRDNGKDNGKDDHFGLDPGGLWDQLTGGGNREDRPEPGQPADDVDLRTFLSSLPASVSRGLRDQAIEVFREAAPEKKRELLNQLRATLPEEVDDVLARFRQPTNPAEPPADQTPSAPDKTAAATTDDLLAAISRIYSDQPEVQARFRADVKERILGVPDRVAVAVLQDWQADLLQQSDPDPGTTFRTRLDERIYRQLQAARIPIERLSRSLQQRMREAARQ